MLLVRKRLVLSGVLEEKTKRYLMEAGRDAGIGTVLERDMEKGLVGQLVTNFGVVTGDGGGDFVQRRWQAM